MTIESCMNFVDTVMPNSLPPAVKLRFLGEAEGRVRVELLDEAPDGGADFDIGAVYHCFPAFAEMWAVREHAPWPSYFEEEIREMLPDFEAVAPLWGDRLHRVEQGERFEVDECKFHVLFTYHEGLYSNPMNDASLVFRMEAPRKTVLFLGDLGPEGGDVLYEESRHLLKADIVQMAHHGHMCVGMEVYAAIRPEVCLWCAPRWLWENDFGKGFNSFVFKTVEVRGWMEELGVKKNYVDMDGTQICPM
jgi:hypothetical protein